MSSEDGAMVEPTAVAVGICKVADLRANQTVIVFWLRSHWCALSSRGEGLWSGEGYWS
jgi:hypothetical protein